MSAAVTFSFGSQRNYGKENTARQIYGIDVESADCRMFCSVQTTSRPTVREGVSVYAVIQSVAYSGYMLSLAVWFCNVLFEKQFENLIHWIYHPSRGIHQQCDFAKCHLCTHSFRKSEEDFEFFFLQYFVGKNLTFFRKTWWRLDLASAFSFSCNSGDFTSYFTQATSVSLFSSCSLHPPVSTHFLGTGLGSFQVNSTG